ncbi:LIP-domain-containing protein [Jaminaea rosea]|uniref:triacylglycerol lipase n=1 Tax=Jaminaea rosea TaxID=1569628 RepID=A0A316UJ28_9BASI|nr:LIP-domain-containing protein [Jaminaea rosea]PWN25307.1 LIP-domain-containing protein [Jaminaea rosea]
MLCVGVVAAAGPEPFTTPANLSHYKPGDVIYTRKAAPPPLEKHAILADAVYQLLFRSSDSNNESIAAVTTLVIPKQPEVVRPLNSKGPPSHTILSYQAAQDSVSLACSSSSLWGRNDSDSTTSSEGETAQVIGWALYRGVYLVLPDWQGPHSSYGVGRLAGKVVLDSLRAVEHFQKLNGSQVLMYGASGGGHATAWASTMAASYAPELKVVGASFGGAPLDQEQLIRSANDGPFSLYSAASLLGLATQYPEVQAAVNKTKGPKEAAHLRMLTTPAACTNTSIADFGSIDVLSLFQGGSPLGNHNVQRALGRETLLPDRAAGFNIAVPRFPRYIFHSLLDEVAPHNDTLAYVKDQCKRGGDIVLDTYKGRGWPGLGNHSAARYGVWSLPLGALGFFLHGEKFGVPCGEGPPGFEEV